MAIRYDRQFNQEIRRVVANFNKKVKRLEQTDHTILPDRVLVSDLKKEFTKRGDLKRELRRLQQFSERGAEEVLTIGSMTDTKWGFAIEKERARITKQNLTREINSIESKTDISPRTSDYLKNLKYRRSYLNKPISSLAPYQLSTRQKIIAQDENRENKQDQFYNNMFSMLFKTAYQVGADRDQLLEIMTTLRRLSPAQLADAIDEVPALRGFTTRYEAFTSVDKDNEAAKDDLSQAVTTLYMNLPTITEYYQN